MSPSRVLLIRFGSLGDVVLTFAAGQALARAHPATSITYLVKEEYAPLVRAQPWVSDVWTLPAGEGRGAAAARALRERVHGGAFDVVVDWQTSPRSRYLTRGLARVLRWRAARWQRTRWVSLRWTRPSPVRPAWRRYADAVAPLGGLDAAPPAIRWDEAAAEAAEGFFAGWQASAAAKRPLVALAPGAHWATKRWPEDSFVELGRALVGHGALVLLAGDGRDRDSLPRLVAWAREEPAARWFAGPRPALAAALSRARVAVTNDTGLMHLAGAVGVPVVALFGSTHPALGFAPAGPRDQVLSLDMSCRPCTLHGRRVCPLGHHRCLRDLTVGRVREAVFPLLDQPEHRLPAVVESKTESN